MKRLVVIPARGGSKRLPGKNLLSLGGKPLLAHSIAFARDNRTLLDKIVVSTDDPEIKEIALKEGVEVIDRPSELARDTSPTSDVLRHALSVQQDTFDWVVLLQVTNPLRPAYLLKGACDILESNEYDSLMTVTRNHQKFGKIHNDRFEPFNYEMGQRSQDLDPLYFENGLLYITRPDLIEQGIILGDNNYPLIVNHPYAEVDIDTEEDLAYAEFVLKTYPQP